jgi:hypothetical protein
MIKNCVNCGRQMKAEKETKKYCSEKCKMRSFRKRERTGEKIGIAPKLNHYSPFTHCNNFECKVYLAHNKDFFNAFTKSFVKPIDEKEYWALYRQSSQKVSHLKVFHCPLCLEEHWYPKPLL